MTGDDRHHDDRTGEPTTTTGDTGGAGRPWYRRPPRVVPLAVLLVLLVAGGARLAVAWINRGAEEASTRDVIERYRREAGGGAGTSGFLRPARGVYTYRASGTERLSILGTAQQWGPTMPATLTTGADGCWTLRIDYSTNHWQEEDYCPSGNRLLDEGGRGYQSFDFGAAKIGDTTVFTCDPPGEVIRVDARPGESWPQSCEGRSQGSGTTVRSAGTNTFVGIEELVIGGRKVPALHYRQRRTLSGDQTGTEDTHSWYAVGDAMLLRATHDTTVRSPSPIGEVTYTEQGEFRLTSLRPTS